MPESTPCPICGGFHEPGVCEAKKREDVKEEKVLTPEEQKEKEELQDSLEFCLANGQISYAEHVISLAEKKNISLDFSKPEIASACQKGIETALLNNNIDVVLEINRRFAHLDPARAFELYSSHLSDLLSELQRILPDFIPQVKKSIELLFNLFAFRDNPERFLQILEANPFLAEALQENPRFGHKLILKYPEFDDVSRAKIEFLFSAKKAVLAENPDLDPESLEFRQAMQAKLRSFDRNQEILQAAEEAGIDTEAFLDYAETRYFTLQTGDKAASLSERLQAPITRLGETLDSYAYQVKSVLAEYREDLKQIQVLPDSAQETTLQIEDLEKRLTEAQGQGDERRSQGMAKGLDNLRQKLAKIPQISLWEKLTSDLERCRILKESLNKNQEGILTAEAEYYRMLSDKASSPQERLRLKAKIAQTKEEFTKSLAQLEKWVNDFKTRLAQTLSPLGKDRAEALIQEINERVAEQFSHYETDLHTLNSFFSEKADKDKEQLEGRAMSVSVWARNPDIDLYQGNYSPCCICVESQHMGAECTIADYNTDLGIQVVSVYDEARNEPVVAAWCWLGIDEQGQTALVVDNIEANTLYSANFSNELFQELLAYLQKYAKAIGAKRLVLGKANNDLPTASELAKLPEAGAQYTKLGNGNSRPGGYFLEAEENTVKLLWERKTKPKRAEKREKERPRLELKDVNAQNLTQTDFEAVKALEEKVYEEDIVRGQEMIDDLIAHHGLDYSAAIFGKRPGQTQQALLGYLVAYEDQTDEGDSCVYLEDIAISPDCQGQGFGWNLLRASIERLKAKAQEQGKPILFDMHLRQTSQRLFERHQGDLEEMGVTLAESVLVPDYYDDGDDALYCVYEVR